MTGPKVSRSKAKAAVAGLSRGQRDTASLSIPELYPYGLFSREERNPAYDRDIVITATAALEVALEEAILTKFRLRPDADQLLFLAETRLIRDLYEKSQMAYLLGIIGKQTLHDLSIIRHLRNSFAHSRSHLDLDMPEFQDLLSHLTSPERWPLMMEGVHNQDHRERFIQTCFQLSMYLAVGQEKEEEEAGLIMAERMSVFRF